MEHKIRKSFGIEDFYHYQKEVLEFLKDSIPRVTQHAAGAVDLCLYAPTGYGKTLCYIIAILKYLHLTTRSHSRPDGVAALILVPTRELVVQVFNTFQHILNLLKDISIVMIDGQYSAFEERNLLQGRSSAEAWLSNKAPNENGPDIVISVASRFGAHAEPIGRWGNACVWSSLRYIVIDEADSLLDKQFNSWVFALRHVLGEGSKQHHQQPHRPLASGWLPLDEIKTSERKQLSDLLIQSFTRQKIICTATDVQTFRGLTALGLNNPITIRAQLSDDPLRQTAVVCADKTDMQRTFARKLDKVARKRKKVIIFCRTVQEVKSLTRELNKIINPEIVVTLSGDRNYSFRKRILEKFKRGVVHILVSTDLCARGMDIDAVTHVFHWGLPTTRFEYIHRIGRTARRGRRGKSYLYCLQDQQNELEAILCLVRKFRPRSKLRVLKSHECYYNQ